MRVLFTGGSSFTGYWFIRELAAAGHEVTAVFRRELGDYPDDLRKQRTRVLTDVCRPVCGVAFGDDRFLALLKDHDWDVLCHHGADVTNYKSPDFDVMAAVANNTHNLSIVLDRLSARGCRKIVLTGSVFENDEGAGSKDLRAFSPYALSKSFTWQMFRYLTEIRGLALGKFVIANPFGPYEEARFTQYLLKSWFAGATPAENTPNYVRDNIHVSLLAKVYSNFITKLPEGISRINPRGYVESQGSFTERVAHEMRSRLKLPCVFELKNQTEFLEPQMRINSDDIELKNLHWSETVAWDEFAFYYKELLAPR